MGEREGWWKQGEIKAVVLMMMSYDELTTCAISWARATVGS